jgi:hypothetical protein
MSELGKHRTQRYGMLIAEAWSLTPLIPRNVSWMNGVRVIENKPG